MMNDLSYYINMAHDLRQDFILSEKAIIYQRTSTFQLK